MKRSLALSLLCAFMCLFFVSSSFAAEKPTPEKTFDYSCSYYDASSGKYYCVETSAACNVAHAYVKESGSAASPTLIVLSYIGTNASNCQMYEGSLSLPTGSIIVVNVVSCGCGSSLTTYVRFFRDF
ncbi:hypothetical protein [uncultured Chitinophaga sp.]|jgi:hypothetical protein|uniref:hypothetical protein n=1 Tax=uncultured Chitinophaga sp. TaxID=339340 RepID=UPI0026384B9F|nr:hypothetical protein [uncultured Chitinophaga sp.]